MEVSLSCACHCCRPNSNLRELFGVLAFLTFLAAYAIHVATLVSVWCFFEAILSFIVHEYFRGQRRADRLLQPAVNASNP